MKETEKPKRCGLEVKKFGGGGGRTKRLVARRELWELEIGAFRSVPNDENCVTIWCVVLCRSENYLNPPYSKVSLNHPLFFSWACFVLHFVSLMLSLVSIITWFG